MILNNHSISEAQIKDWQNIAKRAKSRLLLNDIKEIREQIADTPNSRAMVEIFLQEFSEDANMTQRLVDKYFTFKLTSHG